MYNITMCKSTSEAYDLIQIDEIPSFTIVIVPSEKVVGVADTWPIAITKEHGQFHQVKADYDVDKFLLSLATDAARFDKQDKPVSEWLEYITFQFKDACRVAEELGFQLQ